MATTDNLLNMTQNFITPDLLQNFSRTLGQPVEKIQSSLKEILPTFLMGLVSKGTTTEGAQSLVNLVQEEGFDSTPSTQNVTEESYLNKGNHAVNGIFGNQLNSVTSSLSTSTGMNPTSVSKMLGLVAPMAMGVLGSKIKREGLNANGLSGFLKQQKSSLANFIPSGLIGLFGGATSSTPTAALHRVHPGSPVIKTVSPHYADRKKPWAFLGLIALLLIGGLWWFTSERTVDKVTESAQIASTTSNTDSFLGPAPALSELSTFLHTGSEATLPQRFAFQGLVFEEGSANLNIDAQNEIDQIAAALREYPLATARIEGFSDNSGNAQMNLDLSTARAKAVQNELINRGIEANRLEAVGRGSEAPVASNESEAGQNSNRRIEFVLTKIK